MLRSVTVLTAAAAALLPLVSANTFQLDFEKRKVAASPARLARRQTVNTLITNEEILYLINVTVGTPAQSIGLQLDTGSSDIWFPSSSSRYCQQARDACLIGSYDSSASSTYSNPDLGTFEIEYVDGTQIEGQYVSDVLTIGGTTLTNVTMASATSTDQGYGIMGVGFAADESSNSGTNGFTYPNIIDKLVSEGKINTHSYSLWLDDLESNTGSILFGGVDSSKYSGSLISIPIQKDATSGIYSSFTVAWTGLTITGGGQTSTLNPSSAQPAILDSGTTELLLPDDIANSIYNGVGVITDQEYGNIVPCSLANDGLNFNFVFGGSNGPKITVPLSEFVLPLETSTGRVPKFRSGQYKGQDVCTFGIEAAGSDPILFGDTFLRSAYVVYDLDNLEIGMAQTNSNATSGTGNVIAFTSGHGMPDASTTITSVVVSATATGQNGPQLQTTATATGDAGVSATTRSATFSLVSGTAASGGSGSSSSSSVAGAVTIPSVQRSTLAVLGVTIVAFVFGTML